MAKAKAKGDSKSEVFRRIYESHKDLLKVASIADVMKMFEEATGKAATQSDRGLAANIKSRLRQKYGMRRGRRRRRKGARPVAANGTMAVATARATPATLVLEDAISDCIDMVRKIGSERLADVLRLLRKARYELLVRTGAK
jgi:hypothetical protein